MTKVNNGRFHCLPKPTCIFGDEFKNDAYELYFPDQLRRGYRA